MATKREIDELERSPSGYLAKNLWKDAKVIGLSIYEHGFKPGVLNISNKVESAGLKVTGSEIDERVWQNTKATVRAGVRPLTIGILESLHFSHRAFLNPEMTLNQVVNNPVEIMAIGLISIYSLDLLTTLWKTIGANQQLRDRQERDQIWD